MAAAALVFTHELRQPLLMRVRVRVRVRVRAMARPCAKAQPHLNGPARHAQPPRVLEGVEEGPLPQLSLEATLPPEG